MEASFVFRSHMYLRNPFGDQKGLILMIRVTDDDEGVYQCKVLVDGNEYTGNWRLDCYREYAVLTYFILGNFSCFLAHLSRRLVGELIVYRSSRHPPVRPSDHTLYTCISKTSRPNATKFYLKHHWGDGKAASDFGPDWIRTEVSMATCSSHMVIMGKNGIIAFSRLFLIRSFSYLQVMIKHLRAWMKFGGIRPWTTELAALERLKKSHILIVHGENKVITFSLLFYI